MSLFKINKKSDTEHMGKLVWNMCSTITVHEQSSKYTLASTILRQNHHVKWELLQPGLLIATKKESTHD